MLKFAFSLLAWLFLLSAVYSQELSSIHISKESGLPSNEVFDMLTDRKGYLWIAHDEGLSRYDGKNFFNFRNDSMITNAVSYLSEDSKGRIWCCNFNGQVFYADGDSLYYKSDFFFENSLFRCFVDENDYLYYFTTTGYYYQQLDEEKISFVPFPYKPFFTQPNHLDQDRILVELAGGKAWKFGPDGFSLVVKDSMEAICIKMKDDLYLSVRGIANTVKVHDHGKLKKLRFSEKEMEVIDLVETAPGEYWILTTNGVFLWKDHTIESYFAQERISKVIRDASGNYWFSTLDNGIFLVPDLDVKHYSFAPWQWQRLLPAEDGNFFVGSRYGQVGLFDPSRDTAYEIFSGNFRKPVSYMHYDPVPQHLTFFDPAFILDKNYKEVPCIKKSPAAKDICSDTYGNQFWACTGVVFYIQMNPSPGSSELFERWRSMNTIEDTVSTFSLPFIVLFSRNRWTSVVYDTGKEMLIAGGSIGVYTVTANEKRELTWNGKTIYPVDMELNGEYLFVSTANEGIYVFENYTPSFHLMPGKDLLKLPVKKISYIEGTALWILYSNNLQQIDIKSLNSAFYNEMDGLPPAEYFDFYTDNHQVYITTDKGIFTFPADLPTNRSQPVEFYIRSMRVNEKPADFTGTLSFSYRENDVVISLEALSFVGRELLTYRYRINGGSWQVLENGTEELKFFSLKPGNYMIEIMTVNGDGIESEVQFVKFRIRRPYWQQWWFYLVVTLVTGMFFYGFYRYRLNLKKQQSRLTEEKLKLEEELQRSTLASIKAQMNPHFLFNALNTIQSYIYLNDKENAANYLGKFSNLTRMILGMSEAEKISLSAEIRALNLYLDLEKMRFEDSLEVSVNVAPELNTDEVQLPPMLIQPYVENAIKHGLLHKKTNRKLEVNFTAEGKYLIVTIDDNGIGRKRSAEINRQRKKDHISFAVKANQKRLEILNKGKPELIGIETIDKTDAYENPLGTKVILKIPLGID